VTDLTPHFGVFITHEEVTGRRVRRADAAALLSRLNIHGVLKMIALLNASFVDPLDSRGDVRAMQNGLVARFFDSSLKKELQDSLYGRDVTIAVFYRQQQLLMLRLALEVCPTDSGLPWNKEAENIFGRVCLMVNDFAGHHEDELSRNDSSLGVASRLLAIGELPSDSQTAGLVGRAYEVWLQIPNQESLQSEDNYVPIAQRFEEKYGLSLKLFLQGLLLIVLKTESFNLLGPKPLDALLFNSTTYLNNASFSPEVFQKVLEIVSCKLETLRDKLGTAPNQNPRFDFSLLRRYPLIEVEPETYLCYDPGFLRKFFTDGIYWRIHDALTSDEQEKFRSFFGKIFADYVENILGHIYQDGPNSPKHLVKTRLAFTGNRGEVCDVFVQCDNSWVVIETKASLLTTRAKYLGTADALEQDLKGKFVSTKPQSRGKGVSKGVGQLANSIRMLIDGIPTNADEIRLENCSKIYPVLISYDSAVISPAIPEYLEQQFLEQLTSKKGDLPARPKIMPLTVLSINDVEVLTSLRNRHELSSVLSTYRHAKRLGETFAGFIFRYNYYKIDARLSKFFDSFLELQASINQYFD